MNITNIMNFVRTFEPRDAEVEKKLFDMARDQLRLSEEMGLPSTFLLEYDALCDPRYVELFRGVSDNIELGLWYEIVEPLTTDIGIPYNSKRGYRWDWNIDPGYSMAYTNEIKGKLIQQAMEKFREVFGYYPRTVGSWVIETYTMNYLDEHYDIDAIAICRDQISTDAYTMVGGYFNGIYYASKNNIFTPASSEEKQCGIPIIRLLGPDPIHNYDSKKYMPKDSPYTGVFTLEPAAISGREPKIVDWLFKSFYDGENLGFGYTQIGQENSFANLDLVTPLRMQYNKLIERGITFQKMGETGAMFKRTFKSTPATAVSALDEWDGSENTQSVYYDCKNYVANIFRNEGKVFIRALYLFDENIEDIFLSEKCTTFDSVHENMPIVDTAYQTGDGDGGIGIILDTGTPPMTSEKSGEGELTVRFGKSCAVMNESGITLYNCKPSFTPEMCNTKICKVGNDLHYEYKGHRYALVVKEGKLTEREGGFCIEGEKIVLIPSVI